MKVIVKHYLHARIGKPSLNAPTYQYLAPGSELEVTGELFDGDPFEGSSKWLKDSAGNYYWAGGVTFPSQNNGLEYVDPASYEHWHLKNFHIRELHDKGYRGEGVTVCVVDSGIAKGHPGFDYTRISGKSFLNQVIGEDFTDDYRHGTKCAGVIRSNGEKIIGVAPEVDLLVYKGYSYTRSKEEDIIYAIENVPLYCDVVSISFVFTSIANKERLTKAIERLTAHKIVVVAAHGNADDRRNLLCDMKDVISVGAVDNSGEYKPHCCAYGVIDILAPGVKILSTSLKGIYEEDSGTSFAAPFIASICAIMRQINRATDGTKALSLLKSTSKVSNDGLIKIVDPLHLINQLNPTP